MSTNGSFVPASVPECPYAPRMTNAAAIALAAGGGLRENCVVVITDGPVIGNPITGTSATEVELNPVSPTAFGSTARVFTAFDTEAWAGEYDVTTNLLVRLTDNLGNTAVDVDTGAGSPTVQTVFPWGVTTWRDNYMEDWVAVTPVVGALNPVSGNRFLNGNSLDMTGWTSAAFNVMSNNEFQQTATLHIQGGSSWSRTKVSLGTVNCAGGSRINLTDSVLVSPTIVNNATVDATAAHAISVTRSLVHAATLTQNSDVGGAITLTDTEMRGGSATIAAGAFKAIIANTSKLAGAVLVASGGTALRSLGVTQSEIDGGVPINLIGDKPLSMNRSRVTMGGVQWTIDGTGASGLIVNDSTIQAVRIDSGPTSARMDVNRCVLSSGTIFHNGSGDLNFEFTQGASFFIDQQAGSTGRLTASGSLFRGGGTITMLPACTRESSFLSCEFTQFSTVDLSCTGTAPAGGDRYDQLELRSGHLVNSAAGDATIMTVTRSRLLGTSLAGSGTLTISGASTGVRVDDCDIAGVVTLNNVGAGLSNPDSFMDVKVGTGSTVTVTGGDNTVRKIRGVKVEGESTLTVTNPTGSAGLALGDIIDSRIANQSALTVTGARVVGFPLRSLEILNGSTLTVPASGSALQFRVAQNADVNTGAFVHFDTEISGDFTKTLTAANLNRLANKSYDDTI